MKKYTISPTCPYNKRLTQTVFEITSIHFEGDIIPHSWWKHIRTKPDPEKSRKRPPRDHPYLAAIIILAHVVFWYRATNVYDSQTDKIIYQKKKFNKDKLQRSYGELEEMLGLTKRQSRRAIRRLEELNLIERQFRPIKVRGMWFRNAMTLEPNPEQVRRITHALDEQNEA